MCNRVAIAMLLALGSVTLLASQAFAETSLTSSQSVSVLLNRNDSSAAKVIKREVIPGTFSLTRQNGCIVRNPILTTFLDDGTTLQTPAGITIVGNSLSQWRNEYKQPWQSKLTDYEGGEYKIMILKIGKHPSTLLKTEESEEKLIDSQTSCNAAIYKVYRSNIRLIKPISEPQKSNFSLSFNEGWERHFSR